MAASISFVISVLDAEGCQIHTPVVDCYILNVFKCTYLIERTEANLVKVTNLYLGSAFGEGDFVSIDERPDDPILSLTVIKTTGTNAPFVYTARYGSLELPYWGTLQSHIGYNLIAINVLTYKNNPYKYSTNAANITSSVVRIVITDRRGNDVRLYDLQDQLTTTMDLSQVLSRTTEWIDMTHNGDDWKLVAHTNLSVEAMVVDIKLKSRYDCTLYGLFGWTGYPSSATYNIKVVTRGDNKIISQSPWNLPLFYKDRELQITIYNTEFIDGGFIPPLLMTVKCQGSCITTPLD
ncbi:uncharacterized protein LOC133196999 [Saccostrea echinata]|uniref:uncharacterized protein LOC133196999 n=1 Tax=Saccostrea echinata TaxID=191078 RepID=UPI002A82D9C0|nr:uncharacterized protein LOC133196999 [Saccostrea echinata]